VHSVGFSCFPSCKVLLPFPIAISIDCHFPQTQSAFWTDDPNSSQSTNRSKVLVSFTELRTKACLYNVNYLLFTMSGSEQSIM